MNKIINKILAIIICATVAFPTIGGTEVKAATAKKAFTVNSTKVQFKAKKYIKPIKINGVSKTTVVSGKSSAKITWSKVKNADGYYIMKANSFTGRYKQIAYTHKTTYTHKKLKKNKTYCYAIFPHNKVGSKNYVATTTIKVRTRTTNSTKKPDTYYRKSITDPGTIKIGESKSAAVKFHNKNKTFCTTVTYNTSNKSIAVVDKKGKVTGRKQGKATISAMCPSGQTLTKTITVKKHDISYDIVVNDSKIKNDTSHKYTIPFDSNVVVEAKTNSKTIDKTIKINGKTRTSYNTQNKTHRLNDETETINITANHSNAKKITLVKKAPQITLNDIDQDEIPTCDNGGIDIKNSTQCIKDIGTPIYFIDKDYGDKPSIYFDTSKINNYEIEYTCDNNKLINISKTGVIDIKSNEKLIDKQVVLTITDKVTKLDTNIILIVNKKYGEAKPVKSITLNPVNLNDGSEETIKAVTLPTNISNTLEWSSSNTNVAVIDENGKITAKSPGTTKIRVQAKDNAKIYAETTCTIMKVVPTKITYPITTKTLEVGDTYNPSVTFTPINSSNSYKNLITYSSSNSNIASVSSDGTIVAKNIGTVTIKASLKVNNITLTSSITVNVIKKDIKVSNITTENTVITTPAGVNITIPVTISPENATNKTLVCTSDNTKIVSKATQTKDDPTKIRLEIQNFSGEANITIKSTDGSNKVLSIKIKTTKNIYALNMNLGNSFTTKAHSKAGMDSTMASNYADQGLIPKADSGTATWYVPTIQGGTVATLTYSQQPTTASDKNIKWSIDHEEFNGSATIRTNADGTATLITTNTFKNDANKAENGFVIIKIYDEVSGTTQRKLIVINPTEYNSSEIADPNLTSAGGAENTQLGLAMGQTWSLTDAVTKFGPLTYTFSLPTKVYGDLTSYIFTKNGTYNNYVEVFVCDGKIQGWVTNANEKVRFSNGITLSTETNSGQKLGAQSEVEALNKTIKVNGISFNVIVFKKGNGREQDPHTTNILTAVVKSGIIDNTKSENDYNAARQFEYTQNALRVKTGLNNGIIISDPTIEPAIKVAVDYWLERNSLFDENGEAHKDRYGRRSGERLKASHIDCNLCCEIAIKFGNSRPMIDGIKAAESWWNSSPHRRGMIGGGNYCWTYFNDGYGACCIIGR